MNSGVRSWADHNSIVSLSRSFSLSIFHSFSFCRAMAQVQTISPPKVTEVLYVHANLRESRLLSGCAENAWHLLHRRRIPSKKPIVTHIVLAQLHPANNEGH